jgi:NADH-quinone oxidoreductase subunit G
VGAFMRADHPLMTQRLRQAAKRGTQVNSIDLAGDDPLLPLHARLTVAPSQMSQALAQVGVALAALKGVEVPAAWRGVVASADAQAMAQSLVSGSHTAILLGNAVVHAQNASELAANAQWIAQQAAAKFGFLTPAANTVGVYLAGAKPAVGGKSVHQMLEQALGAYVVVNLEPQHDSALGDQAVRTLESAQFVVALTPYQSAAQAWADVMLPIGPFTETSGTYINAQGTPQSFKATVPPMAQSRPAWKVLRVMGNLLELEDFDEESSESVRDAVLAADITARLSNVIKAEVGLSQQPSDGLERIGDVAIYRSDSIVRRAEALQQTKACAQPQARVHPQTLEQCGIEDGADVKVSSQTGHSTLKVKADATTPIGCVRLPIGFELTAALGSVAARLSLERV